MIKVNLADTHATVMPSLGVMGSEGLMLENEVRKEGLKRFLIILIFPMALWAYEYQNIPTKRRQLSVRTTALAEIQAYNEKAAASVAEIKRFKEEEEKIGERIAALNKISKDRQREVRVLDLVQEVLPEKSWLVKVDIKPDQASFEGLALSDFEVSAFMEALTRSAYLMDVNLVSSKEEVVDGITLKRFEISCLLERRQ